EWGRQIGKPSSTRRGGACQAKSYKLTNYLLEMAFHHVEEAGWLAADAPVGDAGEAGGAGGHDLVLERGRVVVDHPAAGDRAARLSRAAVAIGEHGVVGRDRTGAEARALAERAVRGRRVGVVRKP